MGCSRYGHQLDRAPRISSLHMAMGEITGSLPWAVLGVDGSEIGKNGTGSRAWAGWRGWRNTPKQPGRQLAQTRRKFCDIGGLRRQMERMTGVGGRELVEPGLVDGLALERGRKAVRGAPGVVLAQALAAGVVEEHCLSVGASPRPASRCWSRNMWPAGLQFSIEQGHRGRTKACTDGRGRIPAAGASGNPGPLKQLPRFRHASIKRHLAQGGGLSHRKPGESVEQRPWPRNSLTSSRPSARWRSCGV